jgi:outer membrane protein TolC
MGVRIVTAAACAALATTAGPSSADVLTAERAVAVALQRSTQVINADASVLDARGGLYGAYSGVLPRVDASVSRSGVWQNERTGSQVFGGVVIPTDRSDLEQYSTSPGLSGSWSVLNLSSLAGLQSARGSLKAAQHQRRSTRQDVAFATRRQFYEVVRAVRLADVATRALRLARDDERRVNALFQVGSVSKSDLLKAQVRTAQSELDSLTAHQAITNQRIVLAGQMGVREEELGDVDTVLTVEVRSYERDPLLAEASRNRADLVGAEAELGAARAGLRAAQFARLPYVTVSGGAVYKPKSTFTVTTFDTNGVALPVSLVQSGRNEDDLDYRATVALNLDLFTGFQTESRIAGARARLLRAQENRDALRRNLTAEVDQALLAYREATERDKVARRAVESATENLKLTQEKYNVGSATILELIDAQVQLQRALSDQVSAMAAIRVAEAQVDRARGRSE